MAHRKYRIDGPLDEDSPAAPAPLPAQEASPSPVVRRNVFGLLLAGNVLLWALILAALIYLRS